MRHWTSEERKRQSALIRRWKPWKSSTGPKTEDGKEMSKMNAHKHGLRGQEIKRMRDLLKAQLDVLYEMQRQKDGK